MKQDVCEDAPSKKRLEEKVKKLEKEGRKTIEKKGKGWAAQGVLGIPFPGAQRRKAKNIPNNHLDRLEMLIRMDIPRIGRRQGKEQSKEESKGI